VRTLSATLRRDIETLPSLVASDLNLLCEDFLVRYALEKALTSDSRTGEWCAALERDVEALMHALGVPDLGFPERQMNLQARVVLTNMGTGLDLNELQYQ
jgi:hypothetical protein